MSIESVISSKHLILCHPLLLLPSIFPSIRGFSNESVLCIRWPRYWNFSFSIRSSNEYSGLISFRMDRLNLLAVQGPLMSLLQHHSSKASILQCSTVFIVQLSRPYMMITGKSTLNIPWKYWCWSSNTLAPTQGSNLVSSFEGGFLTIWATRNYSLKPMNCSHSCPGGSVSKESACNARDMCSIPGFHPWVRTIPWRRKWQPTPVFLPGESQTKEPGGLQSMGVAKSRTTANLLKHHHVSYNY